MLGLPLALPILRTSANQCPPPCWIWPRKGNGINYDTAIQRSGLRFKVRVGRSLQSADFRATDSGSAVRNVVLRIVGQSVARVDRATALKLGRNNR